MWEDCSWFEIQRCRHLCLDTPHCGMFFKQKKSLMTGFVRLWSLSLCVAEFVCEYNQCQNGGTCFENPTNGARRCQCAYGYTGVHCETDTGKTAVTVLEHRWEITTISYPGELFLLLIPTLQTLLERISTLASQVRYKVCMIILLYFLVVFFLPSSLNFLT